MLKGGYRKEEYGYIFLYDAFPEKKTDIKNLEKESLPNIITSLTVNLSTLERQVEIVPIDRSVFGKTKDNVTVFDIKLTMSGRGYVSTPKEVEEINLLLDQSKKQAKKLTKEICSHFYLAFNEEDRLKSFLGYFYFIERYTHSTFKTLTYKDDVGKTFSFPSRIEESMDKFFNKSFSEAKNLTQRFYWCAMLVWDSLDEKDMTCFQEIKDFRDKLSHGESVQESTLPVEKAKVLAMKLLGTK